ncbi:MAG: alpha-amylase family glycosyl hydrolase [Bacteroidota bacterium]
MKYTTLFSIFCFCVSTLFAQSIPITFQVNMSYQIEQGRFNPNSSTLDIAGTFNGWNGASSKLTDADGDEIYEITVNGFTEGETIEFKFRRNGNWDGSEEFPGGGDNRKYTVAAADNEPLYWYNDEVDPNGAPLAGFSVTDNRVYEESLVYFNNTSAGQVSSYRWEFEGGFPSTSDEQSPVVRYRNPGTYDVTLTVSGNGMSSEMILENYLIVEERDLTEVEWWNESVFYEIFVRSFYDSDGDGIGDFNGIIEKLDYLNDGDPNTTDDLGVTGIWLMPIHESPSYHGYDVIDYRSINPDYGTMEDFQRFLEAAHNRGIRVIIDYVVNHTSTQHPWFQNAVSGASADKRGYYNWRNTKPNYDGPWGQEVWHGSPSGFYYGVFWGGMPDLNYRTPEVKEEIFEIADFWLEDIGVDGFRLDAVKYIVEDGDKLEDTEATFEFFRDFHGHHKATDSESFTVGEAWTSTDKIRPYVEDDGIDFCFDFDLGYAMIDALNSGNANRTMQQLQRIYNVYPHMQYGTFLSNHDQERVMTTFRGDEQKMKTAASIYLTSPGVPFLYYGEEIGMRGTKPDEFIRTPMQWSGRQSAGFTTGFPWIALESFYTVYNVEDEEADPNSILNWYKTLIHIRENEPILQTGTFQTLPNDARSVVSFIRQQGEASIVTLINVSASPVSNFTVDFKLSQIFSKNYEAENLVDGTIDIFTVDDNDLLSNVNLGAYETRIYKLNGTTSTKEENRVSNWLIYPNPSSCMMTIELPADYRGDYQFQLTDISGKTTRRGQLDAIGSDRIPFDLTGLPKGVYFLKVQDLGVKKVVLQ